MRYIDDQVVKFWLKGPGYSLADDDGEISITVSPWKIILNSMSMADNLMKSIRHGISVGGMQTTVGYTYWLMCEATKQPWYGLFACRRTLELQFQNNEDFTNTDDGGYNPDNPVYVKSRELAKVFNTFGHLQRRVPQTDRNRFSSVTQAHPTPKSLCVDVHNLNRMAVRREVYKFFPLDDLYTERHMQMLEDKPTFTITYTGEQHGPIVRIK